MSGTALAQTDSKVSIKSIAESLLDDLQWVDETTAYCTCPGNLNHTTPTGARDCQLKIDGVPTLYCVHASCSAEVANANQTVRAAIFSSTPVVLTASQKKAAAAEAKAKTSREEELKVRAKKSLPSLLKANAWSYCQIIGDSPTTIRQDDRAEMFRAFLEMYDSDDVLWIGNVSDTGKAHHTDNFQTKAQWLSGPTPGGPFTCPSSLIPEVYSRSKENVKRQRYLVIESDSLSKDDVGAIFRWLDEVVGIPLRAVVDTAGKSLHGWFEFPEANVLAELKIILPLLGCDPKMFGSSQPCRLPGGLRDGRVQKLIFLAGRGEKRTVTPPSQALPLPMAYYDRNSGGYWYQDSKGTWLRFQQCDFVRYLKSSGYSNRLAEGQCQSDLDRALMDIQMQQNVDYAGSLAGYSEGLIQMEGKSVLVTDSPHLIKPKPGQYEVLKRMLLGMFGEEQLPYFQAWIKLVHKSLETGKLRPGQAVVFAGPRNSGKSLLQQLVTEILGGRGAHPYRHMTGGTEFNSELFGSEHLIIDDQCGNSDFKSRQKLTAQFKVITAAGSQQCHPKGKPAVTLKPLWRLTVSVNDNPESLLVLPLIREDLADKVMLFKIEQKEMPMPTRDGQQRDAFWSQLMADLPGWLHDLKDWKIPDELAGDRYGVKHFHHSDIIEAVDALSPEMKLFGILEKEFNRFPEFNESISSDRKNMIHPRGWKGTAADLETYLMRESSETRYEARALLSFFNACARFLERLSQKFPDVISRDGRVNNRHYWSIDFSSYGRGEIGRPIPNADDLTLSS